MDDFLTALALAMVFEGLAYAIFPDGMKAMMRQALALPPPLLRLAGLAVAAVGVGVIALVRFAYFSR